MFRSAAALLFATLFLPGTAGAQTVVAGDPQATVRGVGKDTLAACKALWEEALLSTDLEVAFSVHPKDEKTSPPEFVVSLAVDRQGDEMVFTGLASRVRLDRWATRYEARAPYSDRVAWGTALGTVAEQIAAAVRNAPARLAIQPPVRPPVKLGHAASAKARPDEADATAENGTEVPEASEVSEAPEASEASEASEAE